MSITLPERNIKDLIYTIRGNQVMLDSDLAELYGYTVKAMNQQVKNNIERFPDDFMFQLNESELSYLRSKFLTANVSSKTRTFPYAFTEQGIYMLSTVLKGDLAVSQSIEIMRTFKEMRHYLMMNSEFVTQRDLYSLRQELYSHI